jgi:heat shock protein HslJ
MKKFGIPFVVFCLILASACNTTRTTQRSGAEAKLEKDSIEYYDAEVQVRQKDFTKALVGNWNVTTMKRQARMEEETLTNVSLNFNADGTFNGKGGCNNIRGNYLLKGSSIKFSNIVSTKMACAVMEQETAFLQLLEGTVSAFTVNSNQLLLRDGSSNILFTAVKQ